MAAAWVFSLLEKAVRCGRQSSVGGLRFFPPKSPIFSKFFTAALANFPGNWRSARAIQTPSRMATSATVLLDLKRSFVRTKNPPPGD